MRDIEKQILLVQRKQNIIYLTLNRPNVLNALNEPLLIELKENLEKIKNDPSVQAVIIKGAGKKAFSAGADIKYLNQATPLQVRQLAQLAISVTQLIENLGKISIALINGYALGGGLELAESCMLRVANSSSQMGHPEVSIGAVAGWGGTTRLPRLIGKSKATEMLLTGKIISAEEAYRLGLVHKVVASDMLESEGEKILEDVLKNSTLAVNLTWEAVHRGMEITIDESAKLGADYFGLVASTDDFREGTSAFIQKRKPQFKCQ